MDTTEAIIDKEGFRSNIGIILANAQCEVFWAKRIRRDAWQFPQGGMHKNETPEDTLFRELTEEIGVKEKDVRILARTRNWLRYRIPKRLMRSSEPLCVGQKQLWYLLRLDAADTAIHLEAGPKPEFDAWTWVNYWYPLREVVLFKREVYRKALRELAPHLFKKVDNRWGMHPLPPLI